MCWNATFFLGSLNAPSNFHVYSVGGPLSHYESFKEIFVPQVAWKPLPRSFFLNSKSKTLRSWETVSLILIRHSERTSFLKVRLWACLGVGIQTNVSNGFTWWSVECHSPRTTRQEKWAGGHCWGLQGGRKMRKRCCLGHPGIAGRMVLNVGLNLCWQTGTYANFELYMVCWNPAQYQFGRYFIIFIGTYRIYSSMPWCFIHPLHTGYGLLRMYSNHKG